MPTYAYACTECGHRFEAVQAFTDHSLTECPECTGRLRKLFSSVGIVFKGSGFYRTDSRKSATASESGSSNGSKESSGSTSSSSESSPSPSSSSSSSKGTDSNSSSSTKSSPTPAATAS